MEKSKRRGTVPSSILMNLEGDALQKLISKYDMHKCTESDLIYGYVLQPLTVKEVGNLDSHSAEMERKKKIKMEETCSPTIPTVESVLWDDLDA
jgi:hypothetical protein